MGLLLVTHTEQRCLQDVEVTQADDVGEELQEEGCQQQADVHTVDIGIGSDDDLSVAQVVHILLNVKRRLKKVELLILVYHLLGESVTVKRLTS